MLEGRIILWLAWLRDGEEVVSLEKCRRGSCGAGTLQYLGCANGYMNIHRG